MAIGNDTQSFLNLTSTLSPLFSKGEPGEKVNPWSKIDDLGILRNDSEPGITIDQITQLSDRLGAEVWWFLVAILFAFAYLVFVMFYHARLLGLILTYASRVFLFRWKRCFSVESISMSVIGGKIMFRNLQFVTPDYEIKIHDGFISFLWWARVDPTAEEIPIQNVYKKPFQTVKYRVLVKLLGFEYHRYNRLFRYAQV